MTVVLREVSCLWMTCRWERQWLGPRPLNFICATCSSFQSVICFFLNPPFNTTTLIPHNGFVLVALQPVYVVPYYSRSLSVQRVSESRLARPQSVFFLRHPVPKRLVSFFVHVSRVSVSCTKETFSTLLRSFSYSPPLLPLRLSPTFTPKVGGRTPYAFRCLPRVSPDVKSF